MPESYVPFGAFSLNKLPIYVEYVNLCDNLPEWMRERYLRKYKTECWAKSNGIAVDGKTYAERSDESFENENRKKEDKK